MHQSVCNMFGNPVPKHLRELGLAISKAIDDAVKSTEPVQKLTGQLDDAMAKLWKTQQDLLTAQHLKPRNVGGHLYPGIDMDGMTFRNTTDCEHGCRCWMGGSRSGGPEGVSPKGDCPGNPKLRDAYDLLKKQHEPHGSPF